MKENNQKIPALNYKIQQIINNQFDHNVSLFARTIGFKQQTIDRLFKIDSRTGKFPNVSGNMIVAITSNVSTVNKDWLLREEIEGANEGESKGANLISEERFPSDGNPACLNCKKLEQDIFFLRDIITANNLSLARYDRENAELRAELEECKGSASKAG